MVLLHTSRGFQQVTSLVYFSNRYCSTAVQCQAIFVKKYDRGYLGRIKVCGKDKVTHEGSIQVDGLF